MSWLYSLLFAFLELGVGEGESDPPLEEDASGSEEPGPGAGDEDDLTNLGEHAEEATEKERTRAAEARKREIETIAEETARRVRPSPTPQPSAEMLIRQREEEEYEELRRSEASQVVLRDKRWEIDTNRTLRSSDAKSNAALFRAEELNDKSEFRELAGDPTQGPIYRAYRDKVEEALVGLRQNGTNVPRVTLMYYLYGKDRAQGKIKAKAVARKVEDAEAALPRNVTKINRGRSPAVGARGDVSANVRGGATRKQELEKRLAGKAI